MTYTSWNIKPPPKKQPCSPQSRMEQGLRFKAMYASLGLTVDDVANFLQVTPRTVQLWISGRVRVPYAAYKLMRLQLQADVPVILAVLAPHHFHEHAEHRKYFMRHFAVKGTEAAQACLQTVAGLLRLKSMLPS